MTKAPFEVVEMGWGEFEVLIQIFFKDASISPIKMPPHFLRLYPDGYDSSMPVPPSLRMTPVVNEVYDELVFSNPCDTFHKMLVQYQEGNSEKDHEQRLPYFGQYEVRWRHTLHSSPL